METKISVTFIFDNGCTQHLNMTLDAYNYFISEENVPRKTTKSLWKRITTTKRLEHYLSEIMEDLGAVDVSYKIMKTV